jgi:glycosyltransferase involved in cell wall biosynthesis
MDGWQKGDWQKGGGPDGLTTHTDDTAHTDDVAGAHQAWQTQVLAAPSEPVVAKFDVSIVLPAYNEELAIEWVLAEIVAAIDGDRWSYEIVVVDDASDDRTAELAERFAADCWQCPVRVIRRPRRAGAGAARKTGIRECLGDIVVMTDADGTYPAEAIPKLLEQFPAYDQVNGARTSEQGTLPLLRGPAKWLIRMLACYLTGVRIPDLNTGLKAFKREAMRPWLWVVPDGFSCVTTMTLAFLTNGYAVKYVPIEYRPRIGTSKFHPIKDTAAYLGTVLRIVLYFRPLKIFLPVSGALIVAGVVKSLLSFHLTGSMQESDVIVLVAGFMTSMLGLLAEVIVAHHRR